jgi:hypothetical protein
MARTGRPRTPLIIRFFKLYPDRPRDGCWVNPNRHTAGYHTISQAPERKSRQKGAHVVSYELFVGPVPDGMILDHVVCQNRSCANWRHLEPVTYLENFRRGRSPTAVSYRNGTCLKGGHSMADAYVKENGSRQCRTCQLEYGDRRRQRLREAAAA